MVDVHFDFETYSECDLKTAGTWAYSEHPSTEVICMSYAYENENPRMWLPGDPLPEFLKEETHEEYRLHAHNSFFEYCIILNTMKLKSAPIEFWVDTAAMAAALSLPRALMNLCPVLGVPLKDAKGKYGMYLIRKLCIPQKYTAKEIKDTGYLKEGATYRNRDPELLDKMYEYCIQDVISERACTKTMIPLSPTEQEVWQIDQVINIRGVNVDVELVNHCIAIYEKQRDQLEVQLKEMTGLENPNSQQQFLGWAKDLGYTEDNLQADTLRDYLEELGDKPELHTTHSLKNAIKLKVSLSRTAPKKFYALLRRLGIDGRNHGSFMFHGAGTGRWASLGINLQNLLRPKMEDVDLIISMLPERDHELLELYWGDTIEALASCIRGMLIPSPGGRLIICDYAQVEARIIAWLAGEDGTLEVFRQGKDIYTHEASKIFQMYSGDIGKDERFAGKTAVLACGFQGGWSALQRMAKNYGKVLEDKFCNEIVMKWRKNNPRIVQYWDALENTAVAAIKNPGQSFCVAGYMEEDELPTVRYKFTKGYLFCQLPSGRLLAYASPSLVTKIVSYFKIEEGEYSRSVVFSPEVHTVAQFYTMAEQHDTEVKEFETHSIRYYGVHPKTKQWTQLYLYGGMQAENVTQAVARDLLAHAMVEAEKRGYEIVLHVHDELVADAPHGKGNLAELKEIMLDSPKWAGGLPLDATGCETERFKK